MYVITFLYIFSIIFYVLYAYIPFPSLLLWLALWTTAVKWNYPTTSQTLRKKLLKWTQTMSSLLGELKCGEQTTSKINKSQRVHGFFFFDTFPGSAFCSPTIYVVTSTRRHLQHDLSPQMSLPVRAECVSLSALVFSCVFLTAYMC